MRFRSISPRVLATSAALVLCAGTGFAEERVYGTYDFDGRATVDLTSTELPFGLGALNLGDTFAASGSVKLQRGRLTVQLDEPISRREVIRLDRKIRTPKRNTYRYRKSGKTTFQGNSLDYRVVLNLRRNSGKWNGQARVETTASSGDFSGSSANIRGRVEQR